MDKKSKNLNGHEKCLELKKQKGHKNGSISKFSKKGQQSNN